MLKRMHENLPGTMTIGLKRWSGASHKIEYLTWSCGKLPTATVTVTVTVTGSPGIYFSNVS
jgi:hypothetical protein